MNYLTEALKDRIKREISISTSKSSGPGGQHVNKVNTQVEIRFDILRSAAFNPEQKQLILRSLSSKFTKNLELIVIANQTRSQYKNKELAFEKLFGMLEEALKINLARIPTKATKSSKMKRLEKKKRLSEIKKYRKNITFNND